MIGFKQFLLESQYQNLFHATSADGAAGIVFYNNINNSTNHSGHLGIKKPGVSLTRSYQTAVQYGFHEADFRTVIVFELDQNKLRQNMKITPINYFGLPGYDTGKDTSKLVARHILGDWRDESRIHRMNEYEEFVIGRINNINKYIIKIHVCSELTYDQIKEYRELFTHPKLYNSTKGAKGYFYNA